MRKATNILVITTGGTIGALPYRDFSFSKDSISAMPRKGQDFVRDALQESPSEGVRCISYEPRDSKLIDEPYRRGLIMIIETAVENQILITHGTDRILETAEYFFQEAEKNQLLQNKVILLTGSMIPLSNGTQSDGYLNLKFSLEELTVLAKNKGSKGVYIVLCDYERADDETSAWQPKFYRYFPGRYEKYYAEDRRYSRLRIIK